METIQEGSAGTAVSHETSAAAVVPAKPRRQLPPKGSCWYCEKPVDNVRRFCGKECADGFDDEAAFNPPA